MLLVEGMANLPVVEQQQLTMHVHIVCTLHMFQISSIPKRVNCEKRALIHMQQRGLQEGQDCQVDHWQEISAWEL